MSGIKAFIDALKRAKNVLETTMDEDAVEVAHNLYAQIQNRIIQTGKDSGGAKLKPYSQKQVPKYFYYGRSRSAGADTRVRSVKKQTISYEEFHRLNNLQTGHTDLYFTGEMWGGTGVQITTRLFFFRSVEISGRTHNARQKIDWNSERYGGSILEPSFSEVEAAKRAYIKKRLSRTRIW